MKKVQLTKIFFVTVLSIVIITGVGYAQGEWDTTLSGDHIYNTNTGKVGIGTGTATPKQTFHIYKISGDLFQVLEGSNSNSVGIRFHDEDGLQWAIAKTNQENPNFNVVGRYTDGTWEKNSIVVQRDGDIILNDGNVGIGIHSPAHKLHVYDNVSAYSYFLLGVNDAARGFTIKKNSASSPYDTHIYWSSHPTNSAGDLTFYSAKDTPRVTFLSSGNVGIGTTDPQNELDVNGVIRAKEVKVETGWSDFVFEEGYELPSLAKVESYIKENRHLPDIPSAKEVKEKGLAVSDMLTKQMQKIEELTLYMIQLKKENELRVAELKKRIAALEKDK